MFGDKLQTGNTAGSLKLGFQENTHRALALKAAEKGNCINRIVSGKLAQV